MGAGERLGRPLLDLARHVRGAVLGPWRPGQVVMFHTGRCGSTVIADMINQHPEVWWDGEIYEIERQRLAAAGAGLPIQNPIGLLRSRMRLAGSHFFGFEFKFLPEDHPSFIRITLPEYLSRLERLGFERFVVLQRRNLLRMVVSVLRGLRTQQWHAEVGEMPHLVSVTVPEPTELPSRFAAIESEYQKLRALLRGDRIDLFYEDHIEADPTVGYRRLAEYLKVEARPVRIRYTRSGGFPLPHLIDNYDAVREALLGGPHEWMLET